ncbi:MAG: hypothetical protein ACLUFT_12675 [Gemmiger formicilis]|uniref:hypothetical protein n=1 Tax=Gemmiger formicilis TaxID=745368 RepID=UPI00399354E9
MLLMTDDGAFKYADPSVRRRRQLYRVTVNPAPPSSRSLRCPPASLDDGVKKPCVIHVVVDEPGRSVLEITLHEAATVDRRMLGGRPAGRRQPQPKARSNWVCCSQAITAN